MARFELRRVAVRVRMRIEMVHVVDNESPVAGSLEPSINLVVARHGGFPLCSEEWKVYVAVMDNIVPVMEVSQSNSEKESEQHTILQCHLLHARTASIVVDCASLLLWR
jgi:hypothetical protein